MTETDRWAGRYQLSGYNGETDDWLVRSPDGRLVYVATSRRDAQLFAEQCNAALLVLEGRRTADLVVRVELDVQGAAAPGGPRDAALGSPGGPLVDATATGRG